MHGLVCEGENCFSICIRISRVASLDRIEKEAIRSGCKLCGEAHWLWKLAHGTGQAHVFVEKERRCNARAAQRQLVTGLNSLEAELRWFNRKNGQRRVQFRSDLELSK